MPGALSTTGTSITVPLPSKSELLVRIYVICYCMTCISRPSCHFRCSLQSVKLPQFLDSSPTRPAALVSCSLVLRYCLLCCMVITISHRLRHLAKGKTILYCAISYFALHQLTLPTKPNLSFTCLQIPYYHPPTARGLVMLRVFPAFPLCALHSRQAEPLYCELQPSPSLHGICCERHPSVRRPSPIPCTS